MKLLFQRRSTALVLTVSMILGNFSPSAHAWSLKTHVWISQQVLNDAADGHLTIAGDNYDVPTNILQALRAHPDRYRMGSLGPDVFPDPIVGQMTTHPGVEGGWQTDDWLKHLLTNANSSEEVAFSYGFVGHAAADIFAHSYVNAYAGDIFLLTDGETEVELRHFVLEKYIEGLTPNPTDINGAEIDLSRDLGTATSFLRETLIKGGEVARQNLMSKAGYHLTSMHEVRHAVEELQKGTQGVIKTLTSWAAKFFEQQLKLEIDLASAKLAVQAAKTSLQAEEATMNLKRDAYQAALGALEEAKNIVQRNPRLITFNEQLWIEQGIIAADALAEAARIAAQALGAIDALEDTITGWADRLGNLVCNTLLGFLPECKELQDKISGARRQIGDWHRRKDAAQRIADEAARLRDATKGILDNLRLELDRATKGLAEGTYDAAVAAAEADVRLQEQILDAKKKIVIEAEALSDKISNELENIIPIVAEIKKAIDSYNPLTLLIQNWLDDIDIAMEEYIKASHRAGLSMLQSTGNPLGEYQEWYACYGQVFVAAPKEVGQAGCLVRNFVEDVQGEVDRVIDGLPEIVRWIVAPTREIRKQVEKKVRPEIVKATFQIVRFLTDRSTAQFLELLTNQGNADRQKLNDVYGRDESGKGLITFGDVASVVERDLSIQNSKLTPEKFPALMNAVTLAKLTLLAPPELNRLVGNIAPGSPTSEIFPTLGGNYTLLQNAVRSIDGNHQWQAYGLPYPRRIGVGHSGPARLTYGRDGYKDSAQGMPIWTNVYLRERVFSKLFPEGVLGALGQRKELQWGNYRFPACKQHPFPHTQDPQTGRLLSEDTTCSSLAQPDRDLSEFQTANRQQYLDRYFQCGKPLVGSPHWTIAGSYRTEKSVRQAVERLRQSYPDMTAEAWRPRGRNKYWTAMVAACTTLERAQEARDVVVRRGIAPDAFVWRPGLPWEALEMQDSAIAD